MKGSHGSERSLKRSRSAFCGWRPLVPIHAIAFVTRLHAPLHSWTMAAADSCMPRTLWAPLPRLPRRWSAKETSSEDCSRSDFAPAQGDQHCNFQILLLFCKWHFTSILITFMRIVMSIYCPNQSTYFATFFFTQVLAAHRLRYAC